jgi:phosphate transport system protein
MASCSVESDRNLADANVHRGRVVSDHTVRAFDTDLNDLIRMLAEMGGIAEKAVAQSINALATRNVGLALKIVELDSTIDALQREIESKAVATVALRQPVAVDLRSIIATLRAASDLERIGDLAKNIAKRVIALNGNYPTPKTVHGLRHMADMVLWQMHQVLESLALRDDAKAMSVWQGDQEIDAIYTSLFREVLTYVMEDPGSIAFSIHLLFCAKNVERIGDHVTNIAEAVHYMIEGHPFENERPKSDTTSSMHIPGIG